MGYGGSVKAMIDTLKNNKMLLRRKSTFTILREQRESIENAKLLKGKQVKNKEFTPELKAKIRADAIKRLKKGRIITITSVIISILIVTIAFYIFIPKNIPREQSIIEMDYYEGRKNIDFYINDGYMWLNKNHYHNAIFQFKLATELNDKDIRVSLGLTAAYAGSCVINNEHCFESDSTFKAYISEFNSDIYNAWLYNFLISIGDTTKAQWLNNQFK